jgi:UDP-N-acetylglucosamine acyltransferase
MSPAEIHPTAIVHARAVFGQDIRIGAYSVIGEDVRLGAGTEIGHHVVLEGMVVVGERCRIGHGSVVGSAPQDLKYREGTPSGVRIGNDTVIREYVTVHRSAQEHGWTLIGDGNLIMAASHIAHDCRLGNRVIVINYAGLTGHVEVEDFAVIGGLTGIHQFTRIGAYAYVGGCSKVVQDVPPCVIVDGNPAAARSVNVVGLRRNGIEREIRGDVQRAFRILYRSGLPPRRALERIRSEVPPSPLVNHLVEFIEASRRGICGPPNRHGDDSSNVEDEAARVSAGGEEESRFF